MNAVAIDYITEHYIALNDKVPLHPIRNASEYDRAVSVLNDLLDAGGAAEGSDIANIVDAIGTFIELYDNDNHQVPDVSGVDMVKFLMEQHGLNQKELPEIGSQGVVSEVLSGRRPLNARQIKDLSDRFSVNPGVFF